MGDDPTAVAINSAGKKAGLQIWRIEKFQLVPQPEKNYGCFFTGDSYILLNTIQLKGNNFRYDLHFWLGDQSSQDERGTAAILSVKMDDALGGYPVQYREIQGFESSTFMGYFKKGVKYQKGGCASGFSHAKTNVSEVKRVLHIKGRRNIRALEVEMAWSSFNQGDCFIIEIDNNIYQWIGSACNVMEKLTACTLAKSINSDEKGGRAKLETIEEGKGTYPKELLDNLAGSPKDIKPPVADEDNKQTRSRRPGGKGKSTLYQVSTDTGKLVVTEKGTSPFNQGSLDSGDCFIVDTGSGNTIFVWKGKGASPDERKSALKTAEKFIKDRNYLSHTKIQVVAESAEPPLFTQYFKNWRNKNQTVGFGAAYSKTRIAKIEEVKIEMKNLHNTPKLAAKHGLVDDGSGKVQVWRIEGRNKVEVDPSKYGQFYAGDSYIILYTYTPKCREEYIIYFWQGQASTLDEITGSAFLATELDKEYGGRPVQVRVVQGKEPMHFLSIFKNPLIIVKGGYDKKAGKETGISPKALYQVRSSQAGGTKAIEVECNATSLNSNDAFLLKTPKQCFIWSGIGASDVEVDAARKAAARLDYHPNGKVVGSGVTPTEINEKSEPAAFWEILGGKSKYADSPRLYQDLDANPARLFVISNAKGQVTVEEVPGEFAQSDLEKDDVMMLDTWNEIFLWIGAGANAKERADAPSLAADYIKSDPRGRDQDCPVITLNMDNEPVTFKGYFPSWDNDYFTKNSDYEARFAKMQMN